MEMARVDRSWVAYKIKRLHNTIDLITVYPEISLFKNNLKVVYTQHRP